MFSRIALSNLSSMRISKMELHGFYSETHFYIPNASNKSFVAIKVFLH
jgi:hypothetical protein